MSGHLPFNEVQESTLEWVDWFNNQRLLEPVGNIPPVELLEGVVKEAHPDMDFQSEARPFVREGIFQSLFRAAE